MGTPVVSGEVDETRSYWLMELVEPEVSSMWYCDMHTIEVDPWNTVVYGRNSACTFALHPTPGDALGYLGRTEHPDRVPDRVECIGSKTSTDSYMAFGL